MNKSIAILLFVGAIVEIAQAYPQTPEVVCAEETKAYLTDFEPDEAAAKVLDSTTERPADGSEPKVVDVVKACETLGPWIIQIREARPCWNAKLTQNPHVAEIVKGYGRFATYVRASATCGMIQPFL